MRKGDTPPLPRTGLGHAGVQKWKLLGSFSRPMKGWKIVRRSCVPGPWPIFIGYMVMEKITTS